MLVLKDGCEFTAHSSFLPALQRLCAVSKHHTYKYVQVRVGGETALKHPSCHFLFSVLSGEKSDCTHSVPHFRLPLCLPGSVPVLALQMFTTGLRMWLSGKHLPNLHSALGSIPSTATSKTPVPPYLLMGFLWGGSVQLLQYVELENRLSFL